MTSNPAGRTTPGPDRDTMVRLSPKSPSDLAHVRAVLLDLFHTLVSLEVSQPPGPSVSAILGVDRDTWWRAWIDNSGDYLLGRTVLERTLPARVRIANPAVTDEQIRQALMARPARFRHVLTHIEPETLAGLAKLRTMNRRLGLVSNCGKDEIAAWPDSPLAPCFDAAVFSCDVGLVKPDPAIYRLAATRLGVEPAECLFVGDGGSDELGGARAAGMTPVLLTRHLEVMAPQRVAPAVKQAAFRVRTVLDLCALLQHPGHWPRDCGHLGETGTPYQALTDRRGRLRRHPRKP